MEQSAHRFYAADLSEERVELAAEEAHHARDVLRLGKADQVELFDGAGTLAVGVIAEFGRARLVVAVRSRQILPRPEPAVELAFAVPKGKRLDWLLEKATELGAGRLRPVVFERSVATPALSEHAQARWRSVFVSAAKQCHLAFLPEIAQPLELAAYLAQCSAARRLMGDPDATKTLSDALAGWSPGQAVAVLVGPEGGITPEETALAVQAGFAPVRLGRNLLRVETAAVALLAAVQAICG